MMNDGHRAYTSLPSSVLIAQAFFPCNARTHRVTDVTDPPTMATASGGMQGRFQHLYFEGAVGASGGLVTGKKLSVTGYMYKFAVFSHKANI